MGEVVSRSRGFWTFWLPHLKRNFPGHLDGVGVETYYRAVNRVEPSLIRVEADEVTYNLHIFLGFEIENLMLQRRVKVGEVPALWTAKVEEYLGIRPQDDACGVLQDVHRSTGLIGSFPTHSLGNLLSLLFYNQTVSRLPDIPDQIGQGEFAPLLGWLREKMRAHGAKSTPEELVTKVTGGPIRTEPFLAYIQEKYAEPYGFHI